MRLLGRLFWPIFCLIIMIIANCFIYYDVGTSNYDARCYLQVFGGCFIFIAIIFYITRYMDKRGDLGAVVNIKPSTILCIACAYPGLFLLYNRFILATVNWLRIPYKLEPISMGSYEHVSDCIFDIMHGVLVAPVLEELLFRKFMLLPYKTNKGKLYAVIVSALLFGYCHSHPTTRISSIFLGIILGLVMVTTNNIYLCILLHFETNLLATFLGILSNAADGIMFTGSVVYVDATILCITAVISVLCLIVACYNKANQKGLGHGKGYRSMLFAQREE